MAMGHFVVMGEAYAGVAMQAEY